MTPKEAAEFLDLIAERAQILRERGVRRVELGGVAFDLAGPDLEVPKVAPAALEELPPDALHDPWTHGTPGPDAPKAIPRRTRAPLVEPR